MDDRSNPTRDPTPRNTDAVAPAVAPAVAKGWRTRAACAWFLAVVGLYLAIHLFGFQVGR